MWGFLEETQNNRATLFITLWLLWVFVGFVFYSFAPDNPLGPAQGIYMVAKVGYSIGFDYPKEHYNPYLWFSTFYILTGASFVAIALGLYAEKIGDDRDNWFVTMVQAKAYRDSVANSKSLLDFAKVFYVRYEGQIRAVVVWLIWVGIMICYSITGLGWPYVQAQYFAISTLTTGGLWGIPEGSPDWLFGLTGFMALTGVPITAVVMAQFAALMVDHGDLEATKEQIVEDVTGEELLMLRKFGLENGDGVIDKAEFIILCMVRMGQDPSLIEFIAQRFIELDDDNSGYLTIEEITGGKYYLKNGNIVTKKGQVLGGKGAKKFSKTTVLAELSDGSDDVDFTGTGKYSYYSA